MASLQPTVGGIPQPPAHKTFADAVQSQSISPTLLQPDPTMHDHANPTAQGLPGLHKGLPSISFTDAATSELSRPFSWTLIGKFSQGYNKKDPKLGRPSVDDLQKYFLAMDFRGSFQLGLLDNRHLLIQFRTQEDYLRVYSRQIWYIRAVTMRIFKWTPYFRVDKESSIVPIWISLPRLPVHLFQRDALFSIARLIGEPLRVDDATSKLKRPSVARLQVELDVLRDRPPKVWIQMGSKEGFWQTVDYDNVPHYCCHCWHLGHHEQDCRVLHPAQTSTQHPQPKQVYVAKQTAPHPDNQQATGSGLTDQQKASTPVDLSAMRPVSATVDIVTRPTTLPLASVAEQPDEPTVSATVEARSVTVHASVAKSPLASASQNAAQSQSSSLSQTDCESLSQLDATVPILCTSIPPLHASVAAVDPSAAEAAVDLIGTTPVGQQLSLPFPTVTDSLQSSVVVTTEQSPLAPPSVAQQPASDILIGSDFPVSTSSLQATYKDVLLDSSLQGVVAQEVGFPSTTVVESPQEHAIVVSQTAGHENDSIFASTATVLPLASSSFSQLPYAQNRWHPALGADIRYNDSDYYQDTLGSEDLGVDYEDTDEHTYDDITDGSEGTHMNKKKARQKLKGLASRTSATIEDFTAQSNLLATRIRKRGRPPGSRNRTYFDVQRTMSTRTTKSTSD